MDHVGLQLKAAHLDDAGVCGAGAPPKVAAHLAHGGGPLRPRALKQRAPHAVLIEKRVAREGGPRARLAEHKGAPARAIGPDDVDAEALGRAIGCGEHVPALRRANVAQVRRQRRDKPVARAPPARSHAAAKVDELSLADVDAHGREPPLPRAHLRAHAGLLPRALAAPLERRRARDDDDNDDVTQERESAQMHETRSAPHGVAQKQAEGIHGGAQCLSAAGVSAVWRSSWSFTSGNGAAVFGSTATSTPPPPAPAQAAHT
jgi:hypothetical protein